MMKPPNSSYIIAHIHHKTHPDMLPIRFYIFKDTTSPKILLSYAASQRLGIVKFQISNEALSIALDTITTKKHVTFRTPLYTYRPIKPKNIGKQPLKPAIKKQPFQDQPSQNSHSRTIQCKITPSKTIQGKILHKNSYFWTILLQLMFVTL